MKNILRNTLLLLVVLICNVSMSKTFDEFEGFVSIKGAQYEWENNIINVGDFEISDHTVTNLEYKAFVDATKYPAPLYWGKGLIPKGKDDYPVIFVNRDDIEAYTRWLTKTTGIVYRLPTTYEFIWAAIGGRKDGKFFWGNDESLIRLENINYANEGNRRFDQWEKYLKPARWGMKNGYGLYNMAGNVWQIIEENPDPSTVGYKFRIESLVSNNRTIMGGSWARSKEYLLLGKTYGQSPDIRHPDLGFRLVREPKGEQWAVVSRKLCAVTGENKKVVLSWAALKSDKKNTTFNVYRVAGNNRDQGGVKINTTPVPYTSFEDISELKEGNRYQYRVIAINENSKEGNPSEWTGVTVSGKINPVIVTFKPVIEKGGKGGGMTPIFGDIEGWGKQGCVIRLDNGNTETSQDPGIPVQIEAFSSTGKSLWRKDIAHHGNIFGSANNAPFNVWDMDGDDKAEVITLLQIGEQNYVAILDGMSGRVLYKSPWTKMATDISRSSTRTQMSIAYLDGKHPSVITQTGIYENEIITAYDNKLNKLWDYKSFKETNGSGGHKIEIADVDGDGKQEIIYGTTCLNANGTLRWSIYRQHPDIVSIHDYIPSRPGLEILYIVESSVHAGIYMVDANTGEVIWKNNREDDPLWSHGHSGWTSDIWAGSPGIECVTNRMGHDDKNYLLFSANGKKIMENFPAGYIPIEWDGDVTRELISEDGKTIGKFNGKEIIMLKGVVPNPIPNTDMIFTADLFGDFRTELILMGTDTDGRKMVMVVTDTEPIKKSYIAPSESLDYRFWLARNKGGGYGSIYEPEYVEPGTMK